MFLPRACNPVWSRFVACASVSSLPSSVVSKSMLPDAGYWQIETEEASRDRLAFFVPNGKLQWTVMPMDALNAPAVFVAMMAILQAEWLAAGLKQCGSQVIVDNILLWAATVRVLLEFFLIVLYVLQKYRPTLKLKKSQFITPRCEFVGIDLVPGDRSPAQT